VGIKDRLRQLEQRLGKKAEPVEKPKKEHPQTTFRCGHTGSNTNCPACRREASQRKHARRKAKRAQAEQARQATPEGRLPDQSTFLVQYDAARTLWSGSLTVRMGEGEAEVFRGEASAVFRLLSALDHQYRDWLLRHPRQEQ
jgi:hypothetical protein